MDISAFKNKRVLILGDIILDRYVHVKNARQSAEAPIPVYEVENSIFSLGGAGNVAANISALGAIPFLVSMGSDSFFVENACKLLDGLDNTQYLFLDSTRKSPVKTRLIENDKQIICFEEQETHEMEEGTLEELIDKLPQIINDFQPDVAILQDYDRGFFSKHNIGIILALCRENNVPVTVDPKYRHFYSYQKVALFKPNLAELSQGLKKEISGNEVDETVIPLLDEIIGAENYLITLSEHGMLYANSSGSGKIPSTVREMRDVSGAGDTVISAAALGIACGWTLDKIAHVSNTAAAIVCEKLHVHPVFFEELESRLSFISTV